MAKGRNCEDNSERRYLASGTSRSYVADNDMTLRVPYESSCCSWSRLYQVLSMRRWSIAIRIVQTMLGTSSSCNAGSRPIML